MTLNSYQLFHSITGNCKYGDQCNYAHGEEELRSTPDLFKTAVCNLWTQGTFKF